MKKKLEYKIKFDKIVFFFSVVIVGLLMIWGNPLITLANFAVLYFIIYLLAYSYIPPVLFFILFYHWIQTYTTVVMSNYIGEDIDIKSENSSVAVLLCLGGILLMTIVYKSQLKKIIPYSLSDLRKAAENLSSTNILIIYIIFYFITNTLGSIAFSFPGLTQIIYSLIQLKWALFCLFSLVCILNKEKYLFLIMVICLEIFAGLFSYFSSFKDVIIYMILVSFSFIRFVRFKQFFIALFLFFLLAIAGIFWQSIKSDYRTFLSGGERKQHINVESEQAYEKLLDLADKTDISSLDATMVVFLSRIAYTHHFQLVLDRIPKEAPHEEGNLWWSNLKFVFTPRAFNSDKDVLNPSEKTNKYAGTNYADVSQGTSISLGYFVEGYIDFGMYGMYLPILLLSLTLSFFYRYFINSGSSNILLNYSIVYAMFTPFFAMESDAIFYTGRLVITILTFLILKYFVLMWSMPFLRRMRTN